MKDLKELPAPEKKVVAKVMTEQGFSSRKIEEITGIDHATVARYAKEQTPDDMIQFETEFAGIVRDKKNKILYKGLDRIEALIPQEAKISEVVKAIETVEGKSNNNSPAVQVNTFINTKKDEYGI